MAGPDGRHDDVGLGHYCLLAGIMALGAWLRLTQLDAHGLWVDEYITLARCLLSPWELIQSLYYQGPADLTPDYSPPLYHLLVGLFLRFGHGDLQAKLPGILFSVATIWLLWMIGRRFFNPRVGLYAAFLFSVSVYMIHYARNVRPYGVILFLLLAGLYSCFEGVRTGKRRYWILYALVSAAGMWTLLTTVGNMAGLGLAVLAQSGATWIAAGRGKFPMKAVGWYAAATGVAFALYLPWSPAHALVVRISQVDFPPTGVQNITWAGFVSAFSQFVSYMGAPGWFKSVSFCLAVAGVVRCLDRDRLVSLLYLASWAAIPLVIFLLMDINYPFFSRRIITCYFLLFFLIALGVDLLTAWLSRWGRYTSLAVGMSLAMAYGIQNVNTLHSFYNASMSEYKEAMLHVFLSKGNMDSLYTTNGLLSFMQKWYLPGVFDTIGTTGNRSYKRLLVGYTVSSASAPSSEDHDTAFEQRHPPFTEFKYYSYRDRFSRVGVVNRSPLVLTPDAAGICRYSAAFDDMAVFRDAADWRNIIPETQTRTLRVEQRGRPGSVTFRFDAGKRTIAGEVVAEVGAVLNAFLDQPTQDAVRVWIGRDGEEGVPAGSFGVGDFSPWEGSAREPYGKRHAAKTVRADVSGARQVWVRLEFQSGWTRSSLDVDGLKVSMAVEPGSEDAPAWRELENIRRNTGIVLWSPEETPACGRQLFAFALAEDVPGAPWLGTLALRRDFLARYPGLAPVHVVEQAGKPVYELYDPFLDRPFVTVNSPERRRYSLPEPIGEARGLATQGEVHFPVLDVDGTPYPLPWRFPPGTVTMVTPGGEGHAVFRPLFDKQSFDPGQFDAQSNVVQNGREPCLRCKDDKACSFTYLFHSQALMTDMSLSYLPRLFCDPGRANRIRVLYSPDNAAYTVLDEVRSDGSNGWTEFSGARTIRVPVGKPRHFGWIRFELANEGCQVWSEPRNPLVIGVRLDARNLAPLRLDRTTLTIVPRLDNPNNFSLDMSAIPERFPGGVLRKALP